MQLWAKTLLQFLLNWKSNVFNYKKALQFHSPWISWIVVAWRNRCEFRTAKTSETTLKVSNRKSMIACAFLNCIPKMHQLKGINLQFLVINIRITLTQSSSYECILELRFDYALNFRLLYSIIINVVISQLFKKRFTSKSASSIPTSTFTASKFPALQAWCKGVRIRWSHALTSAPNSSKVWTQFLQNNGGKFVFMTMSCNLDS